MRWSQRLRALPLRTKLVITVVGAAIATIGASSHLSFRYWRTETIAAAERQALLAASSIRSAVETTLAEGDRERARRRLRELADPNVIDLARVYAPDGTVILSTDRSEEAQRPSGIWLPRPGALPDDGVARPTADERSIAVYLPVTVGGAAIVEVHFTLAPLKAAMDRGARLGLLLVIGSLAAVTLIFLTMIEREVVTPIERVADILDEEPSAGTPRRADEVRRIQASVTNLIRKERAAEQRAAEQEQRLQERAGFAEVGQMAAEMAHEFKRPLAAIRSALGLLEQEYELRGDARGLFTAVNGQLEKLNETMQDLFTLAKPLELRGDHLDVADALDSALAQLAGLHDTSRKRIERDYDPATPTVIGDRHRLEQAFLNVALNAVEAMGPGGTLAIRARPGADGATVEFADSGPGIPTDAIDRVLLPFYSTKPHGTGLGLPLVARVVAAHGGELDLSSRPGSGTIVRISLPATAPVTAATDRSWRTHES